MKLKIILSLCIFHFCLAYSQKQVPTEIVDRFRAIYEENEFGARSFRAEWVPIGSTYVVREAKAGSQSRIPVIYDAASGKRSELIPALIMDQIEKNEPVNIDNYSFTTDGNKLLLTTRGQKEGNRKLKHWLIDLESEKLIEVKAGRSNTISPDGQHILYSKDGNLFNYDIEERTENRLTQDGKPGELNYGNASWSPDSKRILFVQSDVSRIRMRSMLIPSDPSYPGVRETRFARVGETIASMKIGVVDGKGKETQWLPIPIPSEGFYLGQVEWAGNSDEIVVEKLSRFRDKREFLLVDVNNGSINTIFSETDPAWVVASYRTNIGLNWINNYENFLFLSEKDGWRHAFVRSRDGLDETILTKGKYDIIEKIQVDEKAGWFYFMASPNNGTQSYLYRVRLNGKGKAERITPKNQSGTHKYSFSPDSKFAIHTYSSANTPPVTELVKIPDHKAVKAFEDNKLLREKTKSWQEVESFQVDIGEGINIDGWMIKPSDFDPSKKYPVFIYVYGEPHGQTVKDSWGNAMANYHRVIADLGYIVISMDNRGTPSPKGAAWRRAIAGKLGPLSTEEQALALKEFGRTRSYVDLDRVGIWGWSGGGSNTLNALFRKPNDYHLGIAVVPKPIPRLYNAWFQEIYMNTPEVNPVGYQESAPINYAEGLKGNLLIITGSGETNTHVQIVEGLVDRLIKLGKQFDYMNYPNRNHGLSEGQGTSFHLRVYMARYLINHLQPGPR